MMFVRHAAHPHMTGVIFALLVATIFAHVWFGSAPLPFGGPNVILAALAVILSLAHVMSRTLRLDTPSALIHALIRDFRPVLPIMAVSLLLLLWALAVYLFTDTLRPTRLATMGMGIGLLFAVYLSVDSVYRATLMVLAISMATAVSTLFGMAVTFLGDPFLTLWVQIATVNEQLLYTILTEGRTAGLSPDTVALSYQLAIALPLAFAAFLSNLFGHGTASRMTRRVIRSTGRRHAGSPMISLMLYAAVAIMVIGITVNATRSAICGVLVGAVIIVLLSPRNPQIWRRLLFLVPLIPLWLLVFSDTTLTTAGPTITGLTRAGPANGTRHTFAGLTPEEVYTVQLRVRDAHGYGPPSPELAAIPKPDGSLSLTWQGPTEPPTGYQFRLRTADAWWPWLSFEPTLSSAAPSRLNGQGPSVNGLAAIGLAAASDHPRRGHTFAGLTPGEGYTIQLRVRDAQGYGPPSPELTTTAGRYGSFVSTWQDPAEPPTGYQFRIRRANTTAWFPWQTFEPALSSQGPTIAGLASRTTRADPSHTLTSLAPGERYFVQLRARNDTVYGPPSATLTAISDRVGHLRLTWQDPADLPTGYQFRIRRANTTAWWPWQTFETARQPSRDKLITEAQAALHNVEGSSHLGTNIHSFSHTATRARIPITIMAFRHAAAHPLGTGHYWPSQSYLPAGLTAPMVNWIFTRHSPHNQFLVILVYYGFPGLILLILFYALVSRSLLHSGTLLIRSPDTALSFLLAALTGTLAGYGINSLLHNAGPFVGDWYHFFLIGLAFSLGRIAASRQANDQE